MKIPPRRKAAKKSKSKKNSSGSYELSRYNATRHGILSRETVLPWESQEEWEDFLEIMLQIYVPVGPVEVHLVAELADIIWRTRRLRQAETTAYIGTLVEVIARALVNVTVPGPRGVNKVFPKDYHAMSDIFYMTPEEITQEISDVEEVLKGFRKARQYLKKASSWNYYLALLALPPKIREWWDEELAEGDEGYTRSPEDLNIFLKAEVRVFFAKRLGLLFHLRELTAQAYKECLDPDRLEKLNRYETFLDRKVERTLAMLLKLQQLRVKSFLN